MCVRGVSRQAGGRDSRDPKRIAISLLEELCRQTAHAPDLIGPPRSAPLALASMCNLAMFCVLINDGVIKQRALEFTKKY